MVARGKACGRVDKMGVGGQKVYIWTQIHTERECHVKMEGSDLLARKCQRPNHQRLGETLGTEDPL